jgi:hypothetical protein
MARFRSRFRSVIPLFAGLFVGAMTLGWLGIPIVSSEGMIVRSHLVAGDIPSAPEDPAWDKVPAMAIPLSGQVITRPVWPEPSARALNLRSVHNGTEIAFLLEWQDNTKNDRLTPGTFRDGVAVGLPLGDAPAFFCMGQLDHYINIWHWKADWQSDIDRRAARASEGKASGEVRRFEVIPRRKSSVEDLIGGGFSTLTTKEDQGRVQGKATWKDGVWRVVMKRPMASAGQENEARLEPGRLQAVAFAIWNGENKERNGQKAVAPWFQLAIDPVASL